MKKTLNILIIPSLILFSSEIFISIILKLFNTVSVDTQFLDLLNIKIIIFALMLFLYNLIKEFKK